MQRCHHCISVEEMIRFVERRSVENLLNLHNYWPIVLEDLKNRANERTDYSRPWFKISPEI